MEFFRQRPDRLSEEREFGYEYRELAFVRFEYLSAYADEISHIDHLFYEFIGRHAFRRSVIELFRHRSVRKCFAVVLMEHELDLSCAVQDFCECQFPMRAV